MPVESRGFTEYVDNFARLNFSPFAFSFVRASIRATRMIDVEREEEKCESPLFREPHSGHYTRLSRRAERSVFCFLSFFLSVSSFSGVSVSRRRAGPPRSCGSDCSRETGGAARSTNRAPAFAKRHLAPTRAQRCCRAERRRTSTETPDRRSSPRFYPPTPPPPLPPHHHHPSGDGSTCVLRLRSFVGVLTFDTGVLWQD